VALLVAKLPANDVFVDALFAVDVDRSEVRQGARSGRERNLDPVVADRLLLNVDRRVRIPVVAQRVERAFPRGDRLLPVQWLLRLERQRISQAPLLAR